MKNKYVTLFVLLISGIFIASCANSNIATLKQAGKKSESGRAKSNIMLVLGSADASTRATRVSLACDLIKKKDIHFDKIILSGGCGAHSTNETNCEATDMERLLKATCSEYISGILIFKEEGSKSTKENYCNSRSLKINGEDLINKGDILYVVSSHYHALSVSACFKNDGVDAHYYYTCGGRLYDGVPPDPATVAASTDPCFQDYTGIAQNCMNSDWCN
jgi:hypothetical protein